MAIEVREVSPADIDLLLPVFLDMERHYDGENAVNEATARTKLSAALNDVDGVILVAVDGQALGFAALFRMFPSARMETMWYLKELYVAEIARGQGIGELLMREAARVVLARGGSRLQFTTEQVNNGAQKFYSRLGAVELPKVFYQFDGAGLAALSEASDEL
ncbi:GNAT family N-acetyltransferase [Rhizobium sp. LCM 4573]|uniref:GNAT family N-acetyltransferase n=1 Tax=Rhizobium sp. LCM 4573 TaxID=1848291 RepID=UPI0008D9479A|nr:GNAT family N-acetyltransferase [Rhizobium sp. LCM 4573]OHV76645.1 hypothetical protein LCM4573_13670 [Rhizobium sp. LCM 4573]